MEIAVPTIIWPMYISAPASVYKGAPYLSTGNTMLRMSTTYMASQGIMVMNAPKAAQPDMKAVLSPKARKADAIPPPVTGSIAQSSQ